MKQYTLFAVSALLFAAGCNTYDVRAIPYDRNMKEVAIIENPKVLVTDFVNVMEDEFVSRGISVRHVGPRHVLRPDEYSVTYDARQSWDIVTYLTDANVRVHKGGVSVGRGHYHHIGTSLSLAVWSKWRGTRVKMTPLYEELLQAWDNAGRPESR